MLITKYGHSCLHVVDGDARVLIDPGTFSAGFEQLTGLTAVLITHQHPDHLDQDKLPALLAANPDATLYVDQGTAGGLREAGVEHVAVSAGQHFDVGTPLAVHGTDHAVIHRDVPVVANASYFLGGRLLHPGDALLLPDESVDVLAVPAAAPWMALKEAVDYHRAVGARFAFPIHDAVVAPRALGAYHSRLRELGPEGCTFSVPVDGEAFEV